MQPSAFQAIIVILTFSTGAAQYTLVWAYDIGVSKKSEALEVILWPPVEENVGKF